jgi:hypothetical protein
MSNGITSFAAGGTHRAPTEKGDSSWKHPSEFGRVSQWVKRRTKNDLELEKDIYGHIDHPLSSNPG